MKPPPRPPRLSRPRRAGGTAPFLVAGGLVGGLALALVCAHFAPGWEAYVPGCWLRRLTGIPCPLCGATRAFFAAAQGQWGAALRWNPLACLVGVGLGLWCLAGGVDRWFGTAVRGRLRARITLRPFAWLAGALMVLNWIYLCLTLPR